MAEVHLSAGEAGLGSAAPKEALSSLGAAYNVPTTVDLFVAFLERKTNGGLPESGTYQARVVRENAPESTLPGGAIVEIGSIRRAYSPGEHGIRVEVIPLVPPSVAEQRAHFELRSWGADMHRYCEELMRSICVAWPGSLPDRMLSPLWIWAIQETASASKAPAKPDRNAKRNQEICRLHFKGGLSSKEIATYIKERELEEGWRPIKEDRIEQIYRMDDSHKKRSER